MHQVHQNEFAKSVSRDPTKILNESDSRGVNRRVEAILPILDSAGSHHRRYIHSLLNTRSDGGLLHELPPREAQAQ